MPNCYIIVEAEGKNPYQLEQDAINQAVSFFGNQARSTYQLDDYTARPDQITRSGTGQRIIQSWSASIRVVYRDPDRLPPPNPGNPRPPSRPSPTR